MFSKEQITEIIEADSGYNKGGGYSKDFRNDEMVMCYEYQHMTKLQLLLSFLGEEMTLKIGSSNITVTIIADDGQQLLVKEVSSDENGGYIITEFWLVDKNRRLTADMVWQYIG